MILQELQDKGLINCPEWLPSNCHYLTIMGSFSYGVNSDTSDMDVYGFAIPPKEIMFPHLQGLFTIPPKKDKSAASFAFDETFDSFAEWIQHGIIDKDALKGKGREYDFSVFDIVKFFHLLYKNNPNIIDSLFTSHECVIHMTQVANIVRENRNVFLHKGCFDTFKGYAYSQMHKMDTKNPAEGSKRKKLRDEFGYDVKFCYNLVRLLNECEQILTTGTLDLRKNNEQLKAIRRGDMKEAEVKAWASDKERQLEELCAKSDLPATPQKGKIKKILNECLEYHYSSIENCVVLPDKYKEVLQEVKNLIYRAGL
jgi:predicted nucleotidyltransferase